MVSSSGSQSSGGHQPGSPSVGTPSAGDASASVPYTAPGYTGKPAGTTYRVFTQPVVVRSTTGTVQNATQVNGVYRADITGMSSVSNLFVGQIITASNGTGSLGSGTVKISAITSSTSMIVESDAAFTNGSITNILGGIFATGSSSPITITGLTNNTSYNFRVSLDNDTGSSQSSGTSGSVTPVPPFSFVPFSFTPFSFAPVFYFFGFSPAPPFGFTPFSFAPVFFFFGFSPAPPFSFTPGGKNFFSFWASTQEYTDATEETSDIVDLRPKILTPDGYKEITDVSVGDKILGADIFGESTVVETEIISISVMSNESYVYIDGDLYSSSQYLLVEKDGNASFVQSTVIDTTYKRFSVSKNEFVDIETIEDISAKMNNLLLHCSPYDNYIVGDSVVFESTME